MDTIQNGYLTRYLEETLRLCRTMVIKSSDAAKLMNEEVKRRQGQDAVITDWPQTWKYYLNLSGQYHSVDTMMRVVSIDTLETIDFTRANLEIHTATAAAYRFGTRNYYDLVRQYPTQEGLINGILYPCELQKAIDAEDGAILTYEPGLIERNEVSLIPRLERYIRDTMHRWYNSAFLMSNRYYTGVFYTIQIANLVSKVLNLRTAACRTMEVHSFHVRMYLASHGQLDRYLPYLTLRQSLWLYRNIRYIHRNAGKVHQFLRLVDRLLTERGIPLGEYSVRHQDSFGSDYLPEQVARIRLINGDLNSSSVDYHGVGTLYEKELSMAEGNQDYLGAFQARDEGRFQTSSASVMQTKVLHSNMVDYSNAVPEPFETVALREWFSLARKGLYDVVVSFKDPKTSEPYTLFAKDAFLYMQYILMSAEGLTFVEIPMYLNMQQRKQHKPSVDDLMALVGDDYRHLRPVAEEILARQPNITPVYSVSAFYEHAQTITDEAYWHWFLISSMHDPYERALVENMVKALYEDVLIDHDPDTPYMGTWLTRRNLPTFSLDYQEAQILAVAIYEAATGLVIDNARMLKNIQKAMIDLMTELSSYSIQLTREINDEDIIPINWPALRFGNQKVLIEGTSYVDATAVLIESSSYGEQSENVGLVSDVYSVTKECASCSQNIIEVDPSTATIDTIHTDGAEQLIINGMEIDITYEGQDVELESQVGLVGYTSYYTLTEHRKAQLKSIYQ